jgi:cytochrome P450
MSTFTSRPCTSRGSNPDHRILSPVLSPLKVLVPAAATVPYLLTRRTIGGGLPPGPRMPSALQAIAWARRPLPFLERCQRHFGDIFTIRVRHSGTWVILSDPEDVKRVFTADHAVLGVGVANSILGPLLGPRSVMLLEEPEHVRRRKLMLPPFHGERMTGYSEMMADVTRREVATWPIGEPFELWPRMQEITLEAIVRVVFGPLDTDRLQLLRFRLRKLTDWMNDPRRLTLLAAAGPSRLAGKTDYRVKMGPVEDSVLEEVRRRQLTPDCTDGSDIAAMLAEARYEDGAPMTEQDLRDELVTLLTDGPTSSLLSWAFERLLRHPDEYARLRAELAGGEDDAYLDAVVKETMRLCPAAPIVVRKLLEPMELGGYTIAAGTTVAPCVHLVHRRQEIYPQPLRFMPERFLERPAGTYTWIPFGGGVRRCLAASYAQLLMKQVIATVIGEVDLRPAEPRSERPVKSAIAFVPHRHAMVLATRRAARTPASGTTATASIEPGRGAPLAGERLRHEATAENSSL